MYGYSLKKKAILEVSRVKNMFFSRYLAVLVQFDQLTRTLSKIHSDSITKLLITKNLDDTENQFYISNATSMPRDTLQKS